MKIGSVDFGAQYVVCASGARNIQGNGYDPMDRILSRLFPRLYSWKGSVLVTKTITTEPRLGPPSGTGNMPFNHETLMPLEHKPRCIKWSPLGDTLNAVGLTNLGIWQHLKRRDFQDLEEPFILSWMGIGSLLEQISQAREFVRAINTHRSEFKAPFVLQINLSCPNTGHPLSDGNQMVGEATCLIEILAELNVPLSLKFNLLAPVEAMAELGRHEAVHDITLPNTTPWGAPVRGLNWRTVFPLSHMFGLIKDEQCRPRSPLHAIDKNGGGLSTPRVLKETALRIWQLRGQQYTGHITGGGVYNEVDLYLLFFADTDAIALGAVKLHRPLRLQRLIRSGNERGALHQVRKLIREGAANANHPAFHRHP